MSRGKVQAAIVFASAAGAETGIAGLPAAARVVHEAASAGIAECWLEAGIGWQPSQRLREEIERLRGDMTVHFPDGTRPLPDAGTVPRIAGETMPVAHRPLRRAAGLMAACAGGVEARGGQQTDNDLRWRYARLGRKILEATGKPTDGIVSRHINRPVSRMITGLLLRIPGFRPSHATVGTAAIGVVMLAALILLGQPGLLVGAVMFQAASMFDGVDGEAARATFRSSRGGALFDSLVDAVTNLAFVLGLVINLARQGRFEAATYGLCGLVLLAVGLTIIGQRARTSSAPFTFDGVKERIRGTRLGQWLVWLTMRDFLALASVVLVLLGLVGPALVAFSMVMAAWLIVVLATHMPRRARGLGRSTTGRGANHLEFHSGPAGRH